MDTEPEQLFALSHPLIVTAAEMAGVKPRNLRAYADPGLKIDGTRLRLRAELQQGQWMTSLTALNEFLTATAAVRLKGNRSKSV